MGIFDFFKRKNKESDNGINLIYNNYLKHFRDNNLVMKFHKKDGEIHGLFEYMEMYGEKSEISANYVNGKLHGECEEFDTYKDAEGKRIRYSKIIEMYDNDNCISHNKINKREGYDKWQKSGHIKSEIKRLFEEYGLDEEYNNKKKMLNLPEWFNARLFDAAEVPGDFIGKNIKLFFGKDLTVICELNPFPNEKFRLTIAERTMHSFIDSTITTMHNPLLFTANRELKNLRNGLEWFDKNNYELRKKLFHQELYQLDYPKLEKWPHRLGITK